MTTIASVHGALPPYRYRQDAITDAFCEWCVTSHAEELLVRRLHKSARVDTRHLVVPLERYPELADFRAANDTFISRGSALAKEALVGALDAAGIHPDEVDLIIFTTVTGVTAPSIDARIAADVGLRADVKRIPMFGLGCVAGAAGVARLHDYLAGHPDDVAVLLSVELCSLTVQRDDTSVANLVASGLFGDGAAAVVAVGERRAQSGGITGPTVIDSRSHLYPDTERTMGWDVTGSGLKIVLDAHVPEIVENYLGDDVRRFLKEHHLEVAEVDAWICHPGGPKVIEAIRDVLDLSDADVKLTWDSLAQVGNLSSSSVLHVLADTLRQRPQKPGAVGVLMAMGPGFCSELVLLRW